MRYKLLLLDVDGTLVASREGALPSERVIGAVRKAAELIDVAIVTGRPYAYTKPVLEALGLAKGLGVFNGGAEIIDLATGKEIYRQTMTLEATREAIEIALPYGYRVWHTVGDQETEITSLEQVTEPANKILLENVPTNASIGVVEALEAVEGTLTHPVSSWSPEDDVNVTVSDIKASKRYGAEKLMELLGHRKDEAMAIGDGYNDLPLLEAVGWGVAMGDAPDEVKQLADYTTASLVDDGVAVAIEKFIL